MSQGLNLKEMSKKFHDQLKDIKAFLVDVDGILTDGRIFYTGQEIGFNRFFHVHDGYALRMLSKAGLKVGVISGGNSIGLKERVKSLNLEIAYLGNEDKRQAYLDILEKHNYEDKNILYMGDEFFDLPLLRRVGFSATVPTASMEIRESVHYVTNQKGGHGAVREVADMLRYVQNITPNIPDF